MIENAVALHPEGVDRNGKTSYTIKRSDFVALHPEGVDRNEVVAKLLNEYKVALHPEGVDRNANAIAFIPNTPSRPPPGGRG